MNNELLLIDKPIGWTSFDVVAKIRGVLRKNQIEKAKVGHAGTLDPFATGLLIVLTGTKTKGQDHYMKLDKEYEATLKLGCVSTTGDPEGNITQNTDIKPSKIEIETVLHDFLGEQWQTPPQYSAIKINGKAAYKYARAGEKVELKPRKITIKKIELLNYDYPLMDLRIKCSSGTYIRTLGEDIGDRLQTGAYLTALKRTKIGTYCLSDSKPITFFE